MSPEPPSGPDADRPAVSVVVPVYNDPVGISVTLQSLVAQDFDDYEVVVVDNGSTDDTAAVAAEFADRFDEVSVTRETEIQSSYAARNEGIECSSGRIVAFVDADMWADPGWLESMVRRVRETGAEYLACRVLVRSLGGGETLVEEYNQRTGFATRESVAVHNYAPTCCLAVVRDVFYDVGVFDDRLVSNGDVEFGNRVHLSGRELHYEPSITAYHPPRTTLASTVRRYYRTGVGAGQREAYHPRRYGDRSPLDVRYFLPPSYKELQRRVDGFESLSVRKRLTFYLFMFVTKLSRSAGRAAYALGLTP